MKCRANNSVSKKITNKFYDKEINRFIILFYYTLLEHYCFGRTKLLNVARQINHLAEEINCNDIEFEELNSVLADEYEIYVDFDLNNDTSENVTDTTRTRTLSFFKILFFYVLADKLSFSKSKLHQIVATIEKLDRTTTLDELKSMRNTLDDKADLKVS